MAYFLFFFGLYHGSVHSIGAYTFDAFLAAVLAYIAFAGSDYLAVLSLKTESEFSRFVLKDLELGLLCFSKPSIV